jgi:hypothetical protein
MGNDITTYKVVKGKEVEFVNFLTTNLFRHGFGILSKSEMDLILFAAILATDDKINRSDYQLSKFLQISQARIRILKEKLSLKFELLNIEQAIYLFLQKIDRSKIDNSYIEIPINDISLRNTIVSLIEENDIMLRSELNPKIFKLRIEDFFELILLFDNQILDVNESKTRDDYLIEFNKKIKKDKKLLGQLGAFSDATEKDCIALLKDALKKSSFSFGIEFLSGLVPGGYFLSKPIQMLLSKLSEKV